MPSEGLITSYYLTNTISAIVLSIFFIVFTVIGIGIYIKLNRLSKKVDEIADKGIETSEDVKSFVQRTIEKIESFEKNMLTYAAFKKMADELIKAVKGRQKK